MSEEQGREEQDEIPQSFSVDLEEACCIYSSLYTGIVQVMEESDKQELLGADRIRIASHKSALSDLVRDLREFIDLLSEEGFIDEFEQSLMEAQADGKIPVVLP